MKLLYMSCHAILEYDELVMFHQLAQEGHDIQAFSMGSYINPSRPADQKRPGIDGNYSDELVSAMMQGLHERLVLPVLERFDAVVVMHKPEWIVNNWPVFKEWGRPVIWRSIGQSIASVERALRAAREDGLTIVRYSPFEENIPGYIGADAIIRFAKNPDEWNGWNGELRHAAIIGQRIVGRGDFCHADVLDTITAGLPRRIYGPDNEEWGDAWAGLLEYDEFKQAMRDSRCLVYGGTVPACYTLVFAEAMMTGLPVVSIGPAYANRVFPDHKTFEIQNIIQHGVNGYCVNDPVTLRGCVARLLNDHDLARQIGEAGRKTAIGLFDSNKMKQLWLELFQGLGLL